MDDLSLTLTQGHGHGTYKQKFAFLQAWVRTTHPIATQFDSYILRMILISW